MRVLNALLLAALLNVLAAVPLHAQRSGIVGTVADTLGVSLPGVTIELAGTDFGAITNQDGEFRLTKVKPGAYTLFMRRVGFEALSIPIQVTSGEPMQIEFELTPTQVRIAPMIVNAEYTSKKLKRVGFEARKKTSGLAPSRFINRAEIEKRNPMTLTHLIGQQGGRERNCLDAMVYIDGIPPNLRENTAPGGGTFSRNSSLRSAARNENPNGLNGYRALEFVPVKHVEGIEIYTSIGEIPIEFRPGGNQNVNGRCVILLWTRDQ